MGSGLRSVRRPARPLVVGAVVAVVGVLLEDVLAVTDFDTWPWLVAAGIGYGLGLARLAETTTRRAPTRALRTARVLGLVAAGGAIVYVLATLAFRIADRLGAALPEPLEGLFLLGAVTFLFGITVASVVAGIDVMRRKPADVRLGIPLIVCALLLPTPLPDLAGADVPELVAPVVVIVLAALFLWIAYVGSRAPAYASDAA